jgi:carbon-monoxide dehydrogenase medium subunit
MKPAPFDYVRAESLDEATAALASHGDDAAVLAGGQSLVPLLNFRLARPAVLVDINRIPSLDRVSIADGEIRLGALVRARAVERDRAILDRLPVLVTAVGFIGHPQIRNRTTIGGNLAHADPASELPAVAVAMRAKVVLRSARGERVVDAHNFFRDLFTTAKNPDELLTEVRFPVQDEMSWAFIEVARRHGDYAMAAACVGLRLEAETVAEASVALAGCGPTPVRVAAAEELLLGKSREDRLDDVREAIVETIQPSSDLHASADYRRSLAGTLVTRSVQQLLGEAA